MHSPFGVFFEVDFREEGEHGEAALVVLVVALPGLLPHQRQRLLHRKLGESIAVHRLARVTGLWPTKTKKKAYEEKESGDQMKGVLYREEKNRERKGYRRVMAVMVFTTTAEFLEASMCQKLISQALSAVLMICSTPKKSDIWHLRFLVFVGHEARRLVDVYAAAGGLEVRAYVILDAVGEPQVVLVRLRGLLEGVDVRLVGLRVEEPNHGWLGVLFLQKLVAKTVKVK